MPTNEPTGDSSSDNVISGDVMTTSTGSLKFEVVLEPPKTSKLESLSSPRPHSLSGKASLEEIQAKLKHAESRRAVYSSIGHLFVTCCWVTLCVLMLTMPFNGVMENTCHFLSSKGLFFHGRVTGGAKDVYVTLQTKLMSNSCNDHFCIALFSLKAYLSFLVKDVNVCESSLCETIVKHVRTKNTHDNEQAFEFWKPGFGINRYQYQTSVFG
uniref:Uncharacterized protein n=1 Tax=Romanomermis culicivorax TaxID=13658 RepID=A0A915K531_ROMCU